MHSIVVFWSETLKVVYFLKSKHEAHDKIRPAYDYYCLCLTPYNIEMKATNFYQKMEHLHSRLMYMIEM